MEPKKPARNQSMASKDQKNTLFVRNLPHTATKSDLESHFGGVGPIRHTIVVTEPGTEKCKGFGFVTFAFQEDAEKALKSLDGSCIRGRKISLDVAKKRQRREENDFESAVPEEKRKREPLKRKGAKKGSLAMRTVLLTTAEKDGLLTEEEAKQAVGANNADTGFESCVMSADSREARCTFSSWALAGKAAAAAHGAKYHAVVEALQGGKRTRLIVRNLPFLINESELRSRFERIAPLRELRLAPSKNLKTWASKKTNVVDSNAEKEVRNEDNGKDDDNDKANEEAPPGQSATVMCGGYAFVEYFLVADAKFAITKLNGVKVGGRVIAVDHAIGKAAYKAQEQDNDGGEDSGAEEDVIMKAKDDAGDDTDGDASDIEDEQTDDANLDTSTKEKNAVSKDDSANPKKKGATSTDEELSRTVFVRNLLFETSAPELWKAMEDEFGTVEQAVLVTHPATKRPRGTAFVRFASVSSAKRAVERAGEGDTTKQGSENDKVWTETPKTEGFSLQGRPLMISNAVDKSKAKDFDSRSKQRKDEDPRNLRLAWIGMIKGDSPEAKLLSKEDLARRAKAVKEKKVKLERNPNVYVSEVRLCIRNLPKDFDEKHLKQMFLCAAQEKTVSKSEKKQNGPAAEGNASSPDSSNKSKGDPHQPRVVHVTVARDPQRKDRSKGYGFVQYEQHEDALRALKLINNNPKALEWLIKQRPKALKIDVHRERLMRKQWGDNRRLMVEFALEDTRKVQILERIKEKGRKLAEEHKRKRSEAPEGDAIGGNRKKRKNETMNDATKRPSKSERRAALKRERANAALKPREKNNRDKEDRKKEDRGKGDRDAPIRGIEKPTRSPRRQSGRSSETDLRSRDRDRDQGFESERITERPDPKPKKPRKKLKAAEIAEENKFNRLLVTYKQKLAKTGTVMPLQTEGGSGSALGARPRWFE